MHGSSVALGDRNGVGSRRARVLSGYLVTVRQAILLLGALLVLGVTVYLFVEVRAQPAPPEVGQTSRLPRTAGLATPPVHQDGATPSQSPSLPAPAPAPAPDRHAAVPAQDPVATGTPQVTTGTPPDRGAELDEGPKLDAVMAEANKAYDRGDFEEAKTVAGRVLAKSPSNVRMLRIMVSASCVDGDTAVAQTHYANLPASDQEQMRIRCARYGIKFPDKP
jgi:hypothetical protein